MAATAEAGRPGKPTEALDAALGRRFALKYALIAGVLFALYCFPYAYVGISERWFDAYLGGYARLVGVVLNVFGENVHVTGSRIDGRYALEIVKNCDAVEIFILFSAAVLAVKAPLERRAIVLGVGLVAILVLNVTRIVSLYYVGVHFPDQFESLHSEVFPLILVAVTALGFVLSLRWIHALEAKSEPLPPRSPESPPAAGTP